jgi:hypothetical protein
VPIGPSLPFRQAQSEEIPTLCRRRAEPLILHRKVPW